MSRRKVTAGATSVVVPLFVQDTTSTVGAGLGSLVFNSAGLAAKYRREGQGSWTTINLVTATAGTWASGGFVADGGPVTGGYELGVPNAALAAGATWCQVALYGASNMLAVLIEFELDTLNYQATGGKVPATVAAGDLANNALTAAALATDAVTEIAAGVWQTDITALINSDGYATKRLTEIRAYLQAIQAQTDLLPSDPADASVIAAAFTTLNATLAAGVPCSNKTGFSLASGEYVNIADAYLDRTNAIETGLTPRGAVRLIVSATAGKASGMETTTAVLRNAVADTKARITATVDANGNRTAITWDAN